MSQLPRPDARTVAVVAALGALALLATVIVWRRQDLLGVVLALLCVLLATVAGVATSAARQRDTPEPADRPAAAGPPELMPYGIDADTLDALDSRDALRAVRDRRRGSDGLSDR
ncbi:hypothetical protein F8271_02920 [Micromonospora sp. ALFpr18c]|uniref:hypothetical protein n=1 Tax=unclassified Micromonospora TaxID=2617518 RepID=UPI00124B5D97|nr:MULTISPECIES: hypothetical protein [unclassified Micromonospora]KAB1948190.1 hypothetical protein F8271_02920 [Micromonospora sp. ALFpr18c]MDG4761538.1 hypothetical protein [Micromonospora sp. WMMD710]